MMDYNIFYNKLKGINYYYDIIFLWAYYRSHFYCALITQLILIVMNFVYLRSITSLFSASLISDWIAAKTEGDINCSLSLAL